jgi:hypothetical protein
MSGGLDLSKTEDGTIFIIRTVEVGAHELNRKPSDAREVGRLERESTIVVQSRFSSSTVTLASRMERLLGGSLEKGSEHHDKG